MLKFGDLVCVVFGCSVPVVLRQAHRHEKKEKGGDGEGEEGEEYTLVGECYLDAMDGHAMTYFRKKRSLADSGVYSREFILRWPFSFTSGTPPHSYL